MITKSPKFLYLLLVIILVVAADAWRRSWQGNIVSESEAIKPLRKNVREIKRDLDEMKRLWLEQQAITVKLEQQLNQQIKEHNRYVLNRSQRMLEIIDNTDNKLLDELVNGITAKTEAEEVSKPEPVELATAKAVQAEKDEKIEMDLIDNPDISALAATNITVKMQTNSVDLPGEMLVEKKQEKQTKSGLSEPRVLAAPAPVSQEVQSTKKVDFSLPERVTTVPAHTAVPEVIIPDKDPNLTSKTFGAKGKADNAEPKRKPSRKMLTGRGRGVRMTMSDILEAYEEKE